MSMATNPAQALVDLEEVARDRFRNGDEYSAAILRRCGQHFAGLEARIVDLERERDTYCAQNRTLREGVLPMIKRAEAAEARVLDAEGLLRAALAYLPPIDHQDQTRQRIAAFLATSGESK